MRESGLHEANQPWGTENMTPANPFAWNTQNHRLYERLALGPICNMDIVRELGILCYGKRICQIRKALAGTGVTVKARRANYRGTLVEYRLGVLAPGETDPAIHPNPSPAHEHAGATPQERTNHPWPS